jgi:hypothetical protein
MKVSDILRLLDAMNLLVTVLASSMVLPVLFGRERSMGYGNMAFRVRSTI